MNRKTFLIIFLFLLILLVGLYFASEIRDFWIKHIAHLGVMLFAGLTIVGLNKNQLPIKEKTEFKLNQILAILGGIIGLLGVSNFIPVLATKIAGIEMEGLLKSAEIDRVLVILISITVFEEIVFRRILAQSINNKLGLTKGVWISALIFSLGHIYTETGLLSAFLGGVVFAYIYLKTKNIYLSISAHLLYNLSTYFLTPIFLDNFNRINKYSIIISILVIGSVLIYSMFWILKRTENETA
ncbi:CPBP family intramembrane glutamic endopeptidase [Cellulophaga baltica]|uniref:CPBP family intramembrane glutamic endopeptidase n=1 Tax=Cellulophaga baltica TaxID=76594 RepID=UPI0015F4BCB9|nr:CPBP family intramembrane glutamic endopeptidase [Cellulophaga baltica]MBA6316951.1 CPBP family intramembrane metalloprotease [Cellulophaga baltica]